MPLEDRTNDEPYRELCSGNIVPPGIRELRLEISKDDTDHPVNFSVQDVLSLENEPNKWEEQLEERELFLKCIIFIIIEQEDIDTVARCLASSRIMSGCGSRDIIYEQEVHITFIPAGRPPRLQYTDLPLPPARFLKLVILSGYHDFPSIHNIQLV